MAKVPVITKLTAQDGKRAEAAKALGELIEQAKANEPGTLIYALHEDTGDPNVLWFYELFEDEDALKTHSASDTMKTVGRGMRDYMAGRPELIMLRPVQAKGIDF